MTWEQLSPSDIHLWTCKYLKGQVDALKRKVLSNYLKEPPQSLEFDENENGKPYLKNQNKFFFNLSHSADTLMIAISNAEVGVDIEKLSATRNIESIANKIMSVDQYSRFDRIEDPASRLNAFYQYWTGFEALVKALGLTQFADHPSLKRYFIDDFKNPDAYVYEWTITNLKFVEGYSVSVASQLKAPNFSTYKLLA